ncbi:amidohydrolase [Vibrio ulleungensis]|uniref:Amidohydrolase n=1 Tax=Vibrio ulleungensis TaxID=2807619 RepID=A0ABS2HCS3_9VIBR|nr:amidohydrolase [Vibrio ulleungensis]MBM7035395.1 amidohydrolase [Vibrio ulleungensis]
METERQLGNDFKAESFRKQLHKHPELSGHEINTALTIAQQLRHFGLNPQEGIGGHGVICTVSGEQDGETTLLRADFDALPIQEKATHSHVSVNHGIMHACGHDGHTASLLAVAEKLAVTPPKRGKVILLFQPAEETGVGASAMLNSAELKQLKIDNVFAYHNLPGQPLHEVVIKNNTFACASTGVSIELEGKTSHAAYPENGLNPAKAMIEILQFLEGLPSQYTENFALVTIVSAQLGEEAFGVSAGRARILATLRSDCNSTFHAMQSTIRLKLEEVGKGSGLGVEYSWHEPFNAAVNSSVHVDIVRTQAKQLGLKVNELREPMRWSEDFSEFLIHYPGALFCIGSGESHPELHNPDYDFPDEIIETASTLFMSIVKQLHG